MQLQSQKLQKYDSTILDFLEKINNNIDMLIIRKSKELRITEFESLIPNDDIIDYKKGIIFQKSIQVKNGILFCKFLELRKKNIIFEYKLHQIYQEIKNKILKLENSQGNIVSNKRNFTNDLEKKLHQISVFAYRKNLDIELESENLLIKKLSNIIGWIPKNLINFQLVRDKLQEKRAPENDFLDYNKDLIVELEIAVLTKNNLELKIQLNDSINNMWIFEKYLKEKTESIKVLKVFNKSIEKNSSFQILFSDYKGLKDEFDKLFEQKILIENQIYENYNEIKKIMNNEFIRLEVDLRIDNESEKTILELNQLHKLIEDLENLHRKSEEIIQDIEFERKILTINPEFLKRIGLSLENPLVKDYQDKMEMIFKIAENKIIENKALMVQKINENMFMVLNKSFFIENIEDSENMFDGNWMVEAKKLNEQAKNQMKNDSDWKYLNILLRNLNKTPRLCEKILMLLILYISLQTQGFKSEETPWKELINYFRESMKKRNFDALVQNKVNILIQEIENQHFQEALGQAKQLWIDEFSYIDVIRLEQMSEDIQQSESKFQGKDLILFLGHSGSGKSTSILYLAGKTMVEKTIYKDNQPQSTIVSEELVEGITPSFHMKSETKSMTILGTKFNETDLFFWDSPGFSDTAGVDEDFFNLFKIVKSAQKAKTIKVVVLISKDGFGDRGQGVRSLIKHLMAMMTEISDYLQNFLFLFTKYEDNEESRSGILWKLNDLYNEIKENEPGNTNELEILGHIKDQCKEFLEIICPLSGNPDIILKKLSKIKPIKKPLEFFKMKLTENLIQKLKLNEKFVFLGKSFDDYNEIIYTLDQLKFLQKNLEIYPLNEKYENIISCIKQKLNEEIDQINLSVQQNELKNKLIEEIQKNLEKLEFLKKTNHFSDVDLKSSLISSLMKTIKKLKESLEINQYNDPKNLTILNQMFLFKNTIGNYLSTDDLKIISESKEIIRQKFDEKFYLLVELIKTSQFEPFFDEFETFETSKSNFKDFLENFSNLDFSYEFKRKIAIFAGKLLPFPSNARINEHEIEDVKKNISLIENLLDNPNFSQIKEAFSEASDLYMKFVSQISVYFENSAKNLKKENVCLLDYQSILTQMKMMRIDSSQIHDKTQLIFDESIRSFQIFLKNIYQNTKVTFDTLWEKDHQIKTEKVLYEKIKENLLEIKNVKWIQDFAKEEVNFCYTSSVREIEEFCGDLIEEINNLVFSVDTTRFEEEIKDAERVCKSFKYFYENLKEFLNPEVEMKFKERKVVAQQNIEKKIKIEELLNQKLENLEYKEIVSQLKLVDILKTLRFLKFEKYKDFSNNLQEKIYNYEKYVKEGLLCSISEIKYFNMDIKNESDF